MQTATAGTLYQSQAVNVVRTKTANEYVDYYQKERLARGSTLEAFKRRDPINHHQIEKQVELDLLQYRNILTGDDI